MSGFVFAQVQVLPAEPVVGVTLEAYIKCERGSTSQHLRCEDDVNGTAHIGDAVELVGLRHQWLRSIDYRDAFCVVHPDRPATVSCAFWRPDLAPYGYTYSDACHCSLECFCSHFQLQRQQLEQAEQALKRSTEGLDSSAQHPFDSTSRDTGWTVVGKGKSYTPGRIDVGHRLQLRVSIIEKSSGKEVQHRSLNTTRVRCVAEPLKRHMISLVGSPPSFVSRRFTVLTYNILAELYATQNAFPSSQPHILLWQYRVQLILRELEHLGADIICLQEVQSTSFHEDLLPAMDKLGFDAVFKKKTQEDVLMNGGKYAMDGCATFFRRDRFTLVKKYEVEFNKAAQSYVENMNRHSERKKNDHRLMKPNVALILVLEGTDAPHILTDRDNGQRSLVCVANTHIHANQELPDVKLWQVHTLLKGLEKIANSAKIPMVIAGDLNSIPGSAPHTLIVDRFVDVSRHDLATDPLNLFPTDKSSMPSHSLDLCSVYSAAYNSTAQSSGMHRLRQQLDDVYHEPRFTNITHDFKETLDYILFTSPELNLTGVLDLPHLGDILDGNFASGLPNAQCASDHVALMAEFEFAKDCTL